MCPRPLTHYCVSRFLSLHLGLLTCKEGCKAFRFVTVLDAQSTPGVLSARTRRQGWSLAALDTVIAS